MLEKTLVFIETYVKRNFSGYLSSPVIRISSEPT
jgi:hypothetical protein